MHDQQEYEHGGDRRGPTEALVAAVHRAKVLVALI